MINRKNKFTIGGGRKNKKENVPKKFRLILFYIIIRWGHFS